MDTFVSESVRARAMLSRARLTFLISLQQYLARAAAAAVAVAATRMVGRGKSGDRESSEGRASGFVVLGLDEKRAS